MAIFDSMTLWNVPRIVTCAPVELRLITPRNAQQLFVLARDPAVSQFLQWPAHESIDDALAFIHDSRELAARQTAWLPGIFSTETGELLGTTALMHIDYANRRAEIGTWLGVPHQRRGYNAPAKAAIVAVGFRALGLRRLEFLVDVANEHSANALKKLPNIRYEGVLAQRLVRDDTSHDAHLFALLADEYKADAWAEVLFSR